MNSSSHKYRLLVVDDSHDDRELLVRYLRRTSFDETSTAIDEAEKMADAINLLKSSSYDCALLDLGLPDGIGIENVKRIRTLVPGLPVVVLTGLDDIQTAESAAREGASAYVVKKDYDAENDLDAVVKRAIGEASRPTTLQPATVTGIRSGFIEGASGLVERLTDDTIDLLEYKPDQLYGSPLGKLIPTDRMADFQIIRQRALRGEEISNYETIMRSASGELRNVILSVCAVDNGFSLQWLVHDCTDEYKRLAAPNELASIVASSHDAIIGLDLNQNVTSWNRGAQQMFGYTADEMIRQPYARLLPHDCEDEARQLEIDIRDGKVVANHETRRRRRDGSLFDASISFSPLRDASGGLIGASTISRDISERVAAERRILKLNAELEARLAQLQAAQRKLIESEKLASLGDMVAGLTHEVSTPVGVGLIAASSLRNQVNDLRTSVDEGKLLKSALINFLEFADESTMIIQSNMERAASIMDSFKTVSVDQASQASRSFFFDAYLSDILLNLAPKLRNTGHDISVDCPEGLQIYSVPGAWSQILTNLIINSCIHAWDAGQAGKIEISAEINGNNIRVTYRDNGKGIAAENLDRIWDRFYTTRRESGGSGIGMDVVKSMVVELGGNISVKSELGKGIEYLMVVPTDIRESENTRRQH